MTIPRFLIVEGPAGSGKTFLTTHLEEKYGLPIIRGSLPTRAPRRDDAPYLSALNDYSKALEAARCWKVDRANHIIIDRFILSQWVYGTLRAPSNEPCAITRRYRRRLHSLGRSLLLTALKEIGWRTYETEKREFFGFHVLWLILLPDEAIIEERRAKTSRLFSFSAKEELAEYALARCVLPAHLVHGLYGLDDADGIVEKWMEGRYDEPPF